MSAQLDEIIDKVKAKKIIDSSIVNLPISQGMEGISEISKILLDPENVVPLSILSKDKLLVLSIIRATLDTQASNDLKGWLNSFWYTYLTMTVAEDGTRSKQIVSIARGYYGLEGEIELEKTKRGFIKGKSDLKDAL